MNVSSIKNFKPWVPRPYMSVAKHNVLRETSSAISETCKADHAYILRTYCPQLCAIRAGMSNGNVAVRLIGTAFLFVPCARKVSS